MTPPNQYVSVSRRVLDVEDYIDIVRRHASWILGPLFAGAVISCVIAFALPNTYVSRAVLRISPAQISEIMVPTVVTQQMNERIAQMQQDILSRTSLSEMIQRPALNLYRRERDSQPLEDVIEKMRGSIHLSLVNLAGQGGRGASGFQLEFVYPDRFKAQAVVQALITRFTESMSNVTNNQGKVTSDFMNEEISLAKAELDRLDAALTNFRIQNAGHLPEELQVNLQALNSLQQQLVALNDVLGRIGEEKLTLETNLQILKGQRDSLPGLMPSTPEPGSAERIQNDRLIQLNRQISELESQILLLHEMYTDTYPLVRNAKQQLEIKKKQRDELMLQEQQEELKPKPAVKQVANPFLQKSLNDVQNNIEMVNTQLRNKETERLKAMKQLDEVNKSIASINSRVSLIPANQQRYVALNRDHEFASQKYLDLQRKASAASTYDNVNKKKAGENLEVLDNASLPESPTAPNRWVITGIGVGLGLMSGIFLAGVKEVKDTSLKNLKDVRAYTNLPILSSIPLLENDLLVRKKRRLAYVGWSASIILGVVAMTGSMYYHFYFQNS